MDRSTRTARRMSWLMLAISVGAIVDDPSEPVVPMAALVMGTVWRATFLILRAIENR